ncbi:MAG TPA: polysaccharide deacetylase family protein [Cyanophyceae cyanobacterium]
MTLLITELTTPRVPLLGFHGVTDPENPESKSVLVEMDYPKQNLEEFLEYLLRHNYWFLTAQDLYKFFITKSQPIPQEHWNKKPIMISFDDGYKTIATNLLPILEKLEKKYNKKAKVVLFVNPGTLATAKSIASTHLKCENLREGLQKGFYDIQSHGENHENLTKLAPQKLIDELQKAQTQLRICVKGLDPENQVASHLAYPFGAYNQQVEAYASKYYLSSYLYNSRILKYCKLKNYYEIPRLTVNRKKSVSRLIKMAERAHPIKENEKC